MEVPVFMNNVHVKTGDTVQILSGKDRGKQGKVMAVSPKEGKVIVEKCNMVTKHVKPRQYGRDRRHREGGRRHVCLQSADRLPALRQAHPCRPQNP